MSRYIRSTTDWLLACLIGFVLVACSGDETVGVSYAAYNHTNEDIVSIVINGEGGIMNASAHGEGGRMCCIVLPKRWRPGLMATIKWQLDGDWLKDEKGKEVIRDGKIGDDNTYLFKKNRGAIGGERGEARIIWGLLQLLNSPHIYVKGAPLLSDDVAANIANTLASSGSPAAQRRMALRTWQDKLAAALKDRKPAVEQINVTVFGFSRGAAEARVFVNWLFEVCKQEGGGWTFAGIPIRLQFLGIFDTVASVGLANLSDSGTLAGHQGWADNTLEINPAVERCVHFVAGHEVRACFPLDSVRVKSNYPANAMEVMYPGAHSDVGGGLGASDKHAIRVAKQIDARSVT